MKVGWKPPSSSAFTTEDINVGSILAHEKLGYTEQFRADGEMKFSQSLLKYLS